MNNNKDTKLLYLQIKTTSVFIITLLISIILTYNNIQKINNKKTILKENENAIIIINRIIITLIAIIFTYISYEFYKENSNKSSKQDFIASLLTLVSTFILLKTTIENTTNNINLPLT